MRGLPSSYNVPMSTHYCLFTNLHIKGDPLILFNIWDAGSAKALQEIGAKVIATGSWSVAAAHGYDDGEKLSFDVVLANLQRIIASVDLPVTIDLEGGYGQSPVQVQETVTKVIEAGAVGINFEDQIIDDEGLYSIEDQCALFREGALRVTGVDEVGDVRIIELDGHPFFIATLFQPERSASSGIRHPLIAAYLQASMAQRSGASAKISRK